MYRLKKVTFYRLKTIWRRYFKFTSYLSGVFRTEIPGGSPASWQFSEDLHDTASLSSQPVSSMYHTEKYIETLGF